MADVRLQGSPVKLAKRKEQFGLPMTSQLHLSPHWPREPYLSTRGIGKSHKSFMTSVQSFKVPPD